MNKSTTQETQPSGPFTNLNRQTVFDTMLTHLRAQGQAALTSTGFCAYRSDDGLKCAVGAIIPDAAYQSEFEHLPLEFIAARLGLHDKDEIAFLRTCQARMHDGPYRDALGDGEFLTCVEAGARSIARDFDLAYTAPVKETADA